MERFVYLYDGSFEGMLHAVAKAVKDGRQVHAITIRPPCLIPLLP